MQLLQIVSLLQEHNMIGKRESFPQALEWYTWALQQGLVETVFEDGRLVGFLEWIRLGSVPDDIGDVKDRIDFFKFKTDKVLFVCRVIAKSKGVLSQLKKKLFAKNADHELLCWHNRKYDRMVIIKNWRLNVKTMV